MIKTITLTGSEELVEIAGANCSIRNDGAEVIYASAVAGITAGADGVLSIPAGGSATLYDSNGKVYLLGTGSALLIGSDYNDNPFKTVSSAGGSGADEVARAAISRHAGNGEIHVTSAEKAQWNTKADPEDIPDISGKADKSDTYTKAETDSVITEKVAEIVAGAPEDFDTLKEMSDWISDHEDSAASMNSAISNNAQAISRHAGNGEIHVTSAEKAQWNIGAASTLGGHAAEEFVRFYSQTDLAGVQVIIDNGADVLEWIKNNGKTNVLYTTIPDYSYTNLPSAAQAWRWYYYDGLKLSCTEAYSWKLYYAINLNGIWTPWYAITATEVT